MEPKEKRYIKVRYALCLNKIIAANRIKAKENKTGGPKDHTFINSLRKLEAASGISFPIIQSISKGIKNPALTTVIALAEGLNITPGHFFSLFDEITEEEIKAAMAKTKKK